MPRFGLSPSQLVASALAAITATVAASYLGVSGTVIGAALASVVSAIGTAVYGHSLRSTHARVREVVPSRRTGSRPVDQGFPPEARSAHRPAWAAQEDLIHPTAPRGRWRGIAIGSAAMFVVLLTVITGVEVVVGRPISDVVRGESGSGTSLFGGTQPAGDGGTKTPTTTVTVTPSVVVTTPTITQTAPAVTKTATPTATTTEPSPSAPSSSATTSTAPNATSSPLG